MLRSTDPVNPSRTVFDVKKLLESLDCRTDVFEKKAEESAKEERYDLAARYQLRANVLRELGVRINMGDYDSKVEEVPVLTRPALDKSALLEQIDTQLNGLYGARDKFREDDKIVQASMCSMGSLQLGKIWERITLGEFDLPAPNLTTCDGGPVRECRCSPSQLVELLRQRASAADGIRVTDLDGDRYFWLRTCGPETVITVTPKGDRS